MSSMQPKPSASEGFYSPRDLTYIRPAKRRLTEYEAVICNTQPDLNQFDVGDWYVLRPDGRGSFDPDSTALVHPNWFDFRDPSALWQRPYMKLQAQQERSISHAIDAAKRNGSLAEIQPKWLQTLATYYEAFASMEWGIFLAHAYVAREALSDTITMTFTFSGMDRLRHQQDIALYSLDLHESVDAYQEGLGKSCWLEDPAMQDARRLVERLMVVSDWAEIVTMTHLVVDPLITSLIGGEFFRRLAPLHGDVGTPVIEMIAESDRVRSRDAATHFVSMVTATTDRAGKAVPAQENMQVIQSWVDSWYPEALEAVDNFLPLFETMAIGRNFSGTARDRVVESTNEALVVLGLQIPRV